SRNFREMGLLKHLFSLRDLFRGFLRRQEYSRSENRSPHFRAPILTELRRVIHFWIAKSRCSPLVLSRWTKELAPYTSHPAMARTITSSEWNTSFRFYRRSMIMAGSRTKPVCRI